MPLKIYSVTELNLEIKQILESMPMVYVRGEISQPRCYDSGHLYFTLKDGTSEVSAVRFSHADRPLIFQAEHGLQVIATGRVSLYPKRGQYQLIVETLEPAGVGGLQLAYEQLKAKLAAEGLFSEERKRELTRFPVRIGVITSRQGAVLHDILTILARRAPHVGILFYPVPVQGDGAAPAIARAVQTLNEKEPALDALLVGRGGGSLEELWAFNEEMVVRAIAGSRIPIITCIGHETDTTLSDYAADRRAPTPSAAAELVASSCEETLSLLANSQRTLKTILRHRLEQESERLRLLKQSILFRHPRRLLQDRMQRLDQAKHQLQQWVLRQLERGRMDWLMLQEKLNALSPRAVLARGYSIVRDTHGKVIRAVRQVKEGENVSVDLQEGRLSCIIRDLFPVKPE